MREITTHRIVRWKKSPNGKEEVRDEEKRDLNDFIRIEAADEPGPGGANHSYSFWLFQHGQWQQTANRVAFQKGPIKLAVPNGISNEALLAIVADRLEAFQKGEFACHWNEMALESVKGALGFLQERTKDRESWGVEGTMQK